MTTFIIYLLKVFYIRDCIWQLPAYLSSGYSLVISMFLNHWPNFLGKLNILINIASIKTDR